MFQDFFGSSSRIYLDLGAPEAEAEATSKSRVSLIDVYEDYHDIIPALSGERFIIIGRKGCGKSAFAEYICARSNFEPNLFAKFIRKSETNLERVVQIGKEIGIEIDSESLFRWIIYTNILKLFANNNAIGESKDFELLRQFLKKNSGYIDIREFEITSLISKHGFDVSVEQLKRFAAKFNKNIEIKSERAPLYKLVPNLEEVIISALKSQIEQSNNNEYVLFFDDLDIDFSTENPLSAQSLVGLIRTCRYINNEIFGKNAISAKVVILLRDDIEAYIASRFADTAKIFASYSTKINWYQEESIANENELNLKKFINRRISYAMKKSDLPCNASDPWSSLVKYDQSTEQTRTTFKYITNQTLFRPRDLLLFFRPLSNGKFSYPLGRNEISTLSDAYVEELAKEIKNELSSFYTSIQIETIFNAIRGMLNHTPCSYSDALAEIQNHCKDMDGSAILDHLFDRSIVGSVTSTGWTTFKCRHAPNTSTTARLDKGGNIVVQYGIKNYVYKRYA